MPTVKKVITGTKSKEAKEAKKNLLKFVEVINKELENYFDEELKSPFGIGKEEKKLTTQIFKHIKEHNLRPAKRLRASLVYYGYKLFNGKDKKNILKAAMSIELVHTALLMHDDFMDKDETRRGKPTTHTLFRDLHKKNKFRGDPIHYGESMAVDVGDVALCLGFELLANSKFSDDYKIKALARLHRGIANTAVGQAYDITLESLGKAKEKDILNLHLAKTAIYTYENPLNIGATLAGATHKDLQLLTDYSYPAGIAFQLQDDVLGLFGNPEKTGKPDNSDLKQGKMTLLIIKALETADKKQKQALLKYWGKENITKKEANIVRKIVIDTGSYDYSKKISRKWAKKAQEVIPEMEKRKWNKEAINYLNGIAQYMVERDI